MRTRRLPIAWWFTDGHIQYRADGCHHQNDTVARICDSALHDEIEPHDSVTAPSSSQSMSPMPSTSSAATSQDEQQEVEPDDDADDHHSSQNTSVLTSAEHATP